MIDRAKLEELRKQNCDHSGPCSEIPYCVDAVNHLLDTIDALLRVKEAGSDYIGYLQIGCDLAGIAKSSEVWRTSIVASEEKK